jgi:hypothetical protein
MSNAISELMMQYSTPYTMGRTARFAARNGYYRVGTAAYRTLPSSAHLNYAGALYYLIVGSLSIIVVSRILLRLMMRHLSHSEHGAAGTAAFLILTCLLISTWMGSWFFWAGVVKMAGIR